MRTQPSFLPIVFSAVLFLFSVAVPLSAQVVTFDDLVGGQTLFGIDLDADANDDVIFSTTDPGGFNTAGPNPEFQLFVDGAVLEGSSLIDPDVRVDFPNGATETIRFGFVLLEMVANENAFANIELYDSQGNQIGTSRRQAQFFGGSFPPEAMPFVEEEAEIFFDGVAAYALLDFNADGTRFVIDNFSGNFLAVPEPTFFGLPFAAGTYLVLVLRRRR